MSKTINIIPSWRSVGCKMFRYSVGQNGYYTVRDTYPNMVSYLSDGLDSTYQEATWASSSSNDKTADVCYINKTVFANQVLSALPNNATNISAEFVARTKCTTSGRGYVSLIYSDTIDASDTTTRFNWNRGVGSQIQSVNIINKGLSFCTTCASKSAVFDEIVGKSGNDFVFEIRSTQYGHIATVYDVWVALTYDTAYPTIKVKANNSWVDTEPKIKVGGSWVTPTNGYVKVNGVWREA